MGFGLTAISNQRLECHFFLFAEGQHPIRIPDRPSHILDAGEYRLQQDAAQEIAYLVNQKTGWRIELLRANGNSTPERAKLIFENDGGVHILKKVS